MPVTVTAFQPNAFQNNAFQIAGVTPPPPPTATVPSDLGNTDMGVQFQSTNVYLGPSLGWVQGWIAPSRIYHVPPNIQLTSKDSIVLINTASSASVSLPDLIAWVREPFYQIYSPFSRAIWIKDLTGNASMNPVTVVAFGGQTIDGNPSAVLNTNFGILRLYPRPDLTGWFIA